MRVAALLTGMLLMSVSTLSALDHKALAERIVQQMRLEPGGYVRWNLFTDATISIGDKVWVRDGRLQ